MIRLAENRDIPRLISILEQVLLVHHNIRPDLFRSCGTKYTESELVGMIADPATPIFVDADESGTVCGYAFCQVKDYPDGGNLVPMKSIYIDDICVDEMYRGKGIATKLYERVRAYAKEIGCHNVTLCVWEGNDGARKFYEKMGMGVQRTIMEERL